MYIAASQTLASARPAFSVASRNVSPRFRIAKNTTVKQRPDRRSAARQQSSLMGWRSRTDEPRPSRRYASQCGVLLAVVLALIAVKDYCTLRMRSLTTYAPYSYCWRPMNTAPKLMSVIQVLTWPFRLMEDAVEFRRLRRQLPNVHRRLMSSRAGTRIETDSEYLGRLREENHKRARRLPRTGDAGHQQLQRHRSPPDTDELNTRGQA
jgi:hypothetical protein